MKTIFNKAEREELIERINTLNSHNMAQWGKMNLYQMMKHCTRWNDWVLGNGGHSYRQEFLGKLFGKMVLKGMVKDDKPMKKNAQPVSLRSKNKMEIYRMRKRYGLRRWLLMKIFQIRNLSMIFLVK